MSILELKEEAIRQFTAKVESMEDEAALNMELDFLSGIHTKDKNALNLSHHYAGIKHKYADVLAKLAQ